MGTVSKLETKCISAATYHIKQKSGNNQKETVFNKGKCSNKTFPGYLKQALSITVLVSHITCFLIFSIFILYATETTRLHEPTDRFIFEVIHDLFTPLVRASRIASLYLYLHKLPQSYDANMKNCFLLNPYFELESECQMCQDVGEVIDLSGLSSSTFYNKYHHNGIPFVIKDSQTPFNMTGFTEFLSENGLLEDWSSNKKFHKELEVIPRKISNSLRKFFPVPDFIPPKSEIHHQQNIFMDGPSSLGAHYLPLPGFGNAFVIQALGHRAYTLTPVWQCKPVCSSVSVILEPGHVLYYSLYFWRFVVSQPVSISEDSPAENLSIAYLGSFYIEF
ncbi:unnamed protein product [Orchesella dallaii]|uniref:Uncharacterized protein n=1 Tax=Orchesella dallaii TaxID=48710 RepID=A0ABP1S482_9HEXA